MKGGVRQKVEKGSVGTIKCHCVLSVNGVRWSKAEGGERNAAVSNAIVYYLRMMKGGVRQKVEKGMLLFQMLSCTICE